MSNKGTKLKNEALKNRQHSYRVQTSANAVRYPKATQNFLNIYPQLFE